ncbi:ParB N-terminal domain-containing protein [Phycobacter sp. K97]|uniref:ParB N-terminal domain-containing protein n=1 Tax=Phycobacter sedimenti TaxID=3133977 RepID=UPI00311DC1ED
MQNPTTPSGAQPEQGQTLISCRMLRPGEITNDPEFRFRHIVTDKAHVRGLTQTLRASGELDPVLVWQEIDATGQPTGRLVLLDGYHRLAAYATAKPRETVSATVFQGNRAGAMLAAVRANSREQLPLTKNERMDAAWRLVRLPGERLKVKEIAGASGVGARSVDIMRKRWKTMTAAGKTATGEWWRDRQDDLPERKDRPELTNAERCAHIEKIATKIREALGKLPWQDEEIAAEAIQLAVGTAKLRSMAEWLFFADELDDSKIAAIGGHLKEPETASDDCDF